MVKRKIIYNFKFQIPNVYVPKYSKSLITALTELLESGKVLPNEVDSFGSTLLHRALDIQWGDPPIEPTLEIVRVLLEFGADPTIRDPVTDLLPVNISIYQRSHGKRYSSKKKDPIVKRLISIEEKTVEVNNLRLNFINFFMNFDRLYLVPFFLTAMSKSI